MVSETGGGKGAVTEEHRDLRVVRCKLNLELGRLFHGAVSSWDMSGAAVESVAGDKDGSEVQWTLGLFRSAFRQGVEDSSLWGSGEVGLKGSYLGGEHTTNAGERFLSTHRGLRKQLQYFHPPGFCVEMFRAS